MDPALCARKNVERPKGKTGHWDEGFTVGLSPSAWSPLDR
jgi:hypothetical protein